MLSASAGAQPSTQDGSTIDQNKPANSLSSDENTRSWSTKRLSATGRDSDHCLRASTLTGAKVNDSSGKPVGQIQDIIINPTSGRIDFVALSLTSENNNGGKTIPVPWALLRTSSSSQYAASEQPSFTLNADRNKLAAAPAVDWSDLSKSEWRQRIYSYYGVTPQSSMGGAESPSGQTQGEGVRPLQPTQPEQQYLQHNQ